MNETIHYNSSLKMCTENLCKLTVNGSNFTINIRLEVAVKVIYCSQYQTTTGSLSHLRIDSNNRKIIQTQNEVFFRSLKYLHVITVRFKTSVLIVHPFIFMIIPSIIFLNIYNYFFVNVEMIQISNNLVKISLRKTISHSLISTLNCQTLYSFSLFYVFSITYDLFVNNIFWPYVNDLYISANFIHIIPQFKFKHIAITTFSQVQSLRKLISKEFRP